MRSIVNRFTKYDEKETLLRVRIAKNVQDAYDLIRDHYDLTQSDLVRMAPLLLVLLAEGNFTKRREEIAEVEKTLPDTEATAEMLELYRETELRFKGIHFTEHLKVLAKDLDDTGQKSINPEDIAPGRDGLPDYHLFPTTLDDLEKSKEYVVLQKKAEEIAQQVSSTDKHKVPQSNDSLKTMVIPSEYDSQLLVGSRIELGKDLDDDQKRYIRKKFCEAVHNSPSSVNKNEQVLQEVAESIAVEVVNANAVQGKYILPEYDGRLLSNARARLGKYLTVKEKEEVRKLLRHEVRRLQKHSN